MSMLSSSSTLTTASAATGASLTGVMLSEKTAGSLCKAPSSARSTKPSAPLKSGSGW
jgi:hypothetical protein